MYKLFFRFTFIPDVHRSFIGNKSTVTQYCLTQWISKLPRSFEIHWVPVNSMGLAGIVNPTVHKTEQIFNVLIFNTVTCTEAGGDIIFSQSLPINHFKKTSSSQQ